MSESTRTSPTQLRQATSSSRLRLSDFGGRHLASWYTPGLTDALGDRLLLCDNTDGDALEMLRLRAHFTMRSGFEARLRAQAQILKSFHSSSFATIHSIERLEETGDALAIVSSHVSGVRLSDVLNRAKQGRRPLSVEAALYIVRELVLALAALHSHASGLTHGALGPERVVLTARGAVVVVEHALGAALSELGYDQLRFWTELGLGTVAGKVQGKIDPRTDVMQIGLIALAVILGRKLLPGDFPQRIDPLLAEVAGVLDNQRIFPTEYVLSWLERALQRSTSASFRSAVEASEALSNWCDVDRPDSRNAPRARVGGSSISPEISSSGDERTVKTAVEAEDPRPDRQTRPFVFRRVLTSMSRHVPLISISAFVASIGVTLAFVGIPTVAVLGNNLATLAVTTVPRGAIVRIDGQRVGLTPVRHMLEPGAHELEVSKDGEIRRSRIVLRRNEELNQYMELTGGPSEQGRPNPSPPAITDVPVPVLPTEMRTSDASPLDPKVEDIIDPPSRPGSLLVTSPVEVEIFHEGRLMGVSGSKRIPVPSGRLTLELVNREFDYRTTAVVNVQPGWQHTLSVTVPRGIINVNALPWAEVWIDGRRLGETPLGNVAVPIGRHQIVFQHPELGTVSREVLVKVPGETRITVDLRR